MMVIQKLFSYYASFFKLSVFDSLFQLQIL